VKRLMSSAVEMPAKEKSDIAVLTLYNAPQI
jgi:hypothetical protein